jgi:hypothetical protein
MCLSWPVVSASLFTVPFFFVPMHLVFIRHCPRQQPAHAAACHCLPLPAGKGDNQGESDGKQGNQVESKGKLLYLFGTLYACLTYWIF